MQLRTSITQRTAVPGGGPVRLAVLADGVPDTLLIKDSRGQPRFYDVLPSFKERGFRRSFARMIARRTGDTRQPQDVIEREIKRLRIRQLLFWTAAQLGGIARSVPGEILSLEMEVLREVTWRLVPPPFDEAQFAAECSDWPTLKSGLVETAGRPFQELNLDALEFLMCWPALRADLETWDGHSPEHWPALEAAFSLGVITNSPWFLNEVLQRCPAAAQWLTEILDKADASVQASRKKEAGKRHLPKDAHASGSPPDFGLLETALDEMSCRLLAPPAGWRMSHPDGWIDALLTIQEKLEEAWLRIDAVVSAARHPDPANEPRQQLQVMLGQLEARTQELARHPALAAVLPALLSRLQGWQAQVACAVSPELERIHTQARALMENLEASSQALIAAHEAHEEAHRKYEAARAEADASGALPLRFKANQLRKSEAEAEDRLLQVQMTFLPAPEGEKESVAVTPRETTALEPPPPAMPAPAGDSLVPAVLVPAVPGPATAPQEGGLSSATAAAPSEAPGVNPPAGALPAAPVIAEPPGIVSPDDVWQALQRNQLPTAYQMAKLAGEEWVPLTGIPPVALLETLVLRDALLRPDGEMAAAITRAFGSLDLERVSGPPEAKSAINVLLSTSLLRPLLLAPESRAPQLATQIRLPDGCGQLYQLLQDFVEATGALRHYGLEARAFAALRDEGAWRNALLQQEQRIEAWRQRAPHFQNKFAPATAIWRDWQKPGGEIDRLLSPIQTHAPEAAALVQTQLDRLGIGLDRLISEADRKFKRRGEPMLGAALHHFQLRVQEARSLAQDWLSLLAAQPAKDGGRTHELERARAVLVRHLPQARRELEDLSRHPDLRIAAAGTLAGAGLMQTWSLFEPQAPLPAVERNPQLLLNRPLLDLPQCNLRHDGSIRGEREPVLAALVAHADTPSDLQKSFDMRLERRDIQEATWLTEIAGFEDPTHAQPMQALLTPVTQEYWTQQRRKLARLSESIESSLVYGLLSSAEGDACSGRLAGLDRRCGDLAQADDIEDQIAQISRDLEARAVSRRQEIQDAWSAIRSQATPEDITLFGQALAADDLPSATEYLARIRDGQPLQDQTGQRDPFAELHVAPPGGTSLARVIETYLAGEGRNSAALVRQVSRGRPVGALDIADVPEAHRKEAARLLELWFALKTTVTRALVAGDKRLRPLQGLLGTLGFSNVRALQPGAEAADFPVADFECDVIADRALCPVPFFGSMAQGRYRLLCVSDGQSVDQIVRHAGPTVTQRPAFVFYFGRLTQRQRRDLAAETRAQRSTVIVIDEVLLVFLTGERGSRLPALFACTLPFASVDPYVTTSSFVPPELFFGRHEELRSLLDPTGACFVYGGRQLGKTALLRHAARSFHAPARQHYAVWIDLKSERETDCSQTNSSHVWQPIRKHLIQAGMLPSDTPEPDPGIKGSLEAFLATLERWLLGHPAGRVLLLLDEADPFLEEDARHGYHSTTQIKRLMERSDRRFKVAFAGLHNVLRTAELANHPLGHFGEPIEIGPLIKPREWREARQLVLGPLAAAGFQLERPGMADRMLAQTNFYPSLIQLYCSKLIARMWRDACPPGGPRFVIEEPRLDDTYLAKDMRDEIRHKFRLTLQLDSRYAVIAYAMAYRSYELGTRSGSFTAAELAGMARNYWAEGFALTSAPQLRVILEEMQGLGVLRVTDSGQFTLRNPNLLLLMGTQEEVEEALSEPRDLPQAFAPQVHHPRLTGPGSIAGCHPLTLTQIDTLGSSHAGVVILAGSRAAGIERVTDALHQQHGNAHLIPLALSNQAGFTQALKSNLAAQHKDRTTLLLLSNNSPWEPAWVQAALMGIRRAQRLKVVFCADASAAHSTALPELSTLAGVEILTLGPWTDRFLRHWLEESGHAGNGPAGRAALHRKTGFWPLLLEGAPATLERFTGRHVRLPQIIQTLAAMEGEMDLEDIALLMEDDVQSLRRELERGALLGLIGRGERGCWRLEPGLAALLQQGVLHV